MKFNQYVEGVQVLIGMGFLVLLSQTILMAMAINLVNLKQQ